MDFQNICWHPLGAPYDQFYAQTHRDVRLFHKNISVKQKYYQYWNLFIYYSLKLNSLFHSKNLARMVAYRCQHSDIT